MGRPSCGYPLFVRCSNSLLLFVCGEAEFVVMQISASTRPILIRYSVVLLLYIRYILSFGSCSYIDTHVYHLGSKL